MVNAQEWLDKNYPKETREKVKMLDICKKNIGEKLEGKLKLKDFSNLKELKCEGNQITSLDVTNCSKLDKLNCEFNQLVDLRLSKNLKEVICGGNRLTNLDLTNLLQLENLDCSNNLLTNLDFFSLESGKITILDISDNNFVEQDLSFLSHLINLKELSIGNNYLEEKITEFTSKYGIDLVKSMLRESESRSDVNIKEIISNQKVRIQQGIYNRFTGSLESLKNLNKLKKLHISNTDINSGFEKLSNNLK
ncbi:MAG: hypothetical protein I3273_05440 [Candidatus Moeniiplasma glomeromycotorum]|nr:hypothetical protein [Candidatus Moeniiplasma glomeromycotorum]MCE8169533.1 hypothetical protein [Candidatus Moeniiplasma glomeromycotorum]